MNIPCKANCFSHIACTEFKDQGQQRAYNFYKKNCQSVEIVKDEYLQKIHFRVKDPVGVNL